MVLFAVFVISVQAWAQEDIGQRLRTVSAALERAVPAGFTQDGNVYTDSSGDIALFTNGTVVKVAIIEQYYQFSTFGEMWQNGYIRYFTNNGWLAYVIGELRIFRKDGVYAFIEKPQAGTGQSGYAQILFAKDLQYFFDNMF